ncbi:HDIG domain-containing metalloprotein [Thermanaeromonas sp. C210]|uniref:HDIG domain-containing metalloprotein n=1 Tax=Thermanaeromonas sp. C210 TaxID=2731925 RepID=UPI00155CB978|nr:HDIG domain-containing metalloprotein [Thermanaeromonas sp. C210]GFN22714.1 phosphohydrolase [Thermanaeromonas sp. C210]
MQREQALELLQKHISTPNLLKHCLAVEAVMRALARHLGEDEDKWGLAGLLHDIDYEATKDDPHRHSLVGGDMLEQEGMEPEIVYAVKAHNEIHGLPREDRLSQALYATDPLTGLIVAAALIRPEKKLAPVDVPFLLNRYQEKSFARGAKREQIAACRELGLSLEEFLRIGLEAMKGIAGELGL